MDYSFTIICLFVYIFLIIKRGVTPFDEHGGINIGE